jgi:hypothetical protein
LVKNVLLSAGDTYGPASRAFIVEEISSTYAVRIEGRDVPMRLFAESARVTFPQPLAEKTAYLFPFSDQVFFSETHVGSCRWSRCRSPYCGRRGCDP